MDVIYCDCRAGLSAGALVEALREAAGPEQDGAPKKDLPAFQAVWDALDDRPCHAEELSAARDLERLLLALAEPTLHFSPLPLARLTPAALDLVTGMAVGGNGGPVTIAGAALARALGRGEAPPFVCRASGTGRGQGALVRVFLGERLPQTREEVVVLEANLDDFNPEFYPHLSDLLLAAGALDVFLTPVIMKKGRPGTQVTVLSPVENWREKADLLLRESSTLGVRWRREGRVTCPRRLIRLATPYGEIGAKVSVPPDGRRRVKPEYEDCRKTAMESGVPLTEVYRAALDEAWKVAQREQTGLRDG